MNINNSPAGSISNGIDSMTIINLFHCTASLKRAINNTKSHSSMNEGADKIADATSADKLKRMTSRIAEVPSPVSRNVLNKTVPTRKLISQSRNM